MGTDRINGKPRQPRISASPTQPIAMPAEPNAGVQPRPSADQLRLSPKATDKLAQDQNGGEAHQVWEENVVVPLEHAEDYWAAKRKKGGLEGAAGFVMGGLLELSGLPSIARNTSKALDQRKSTGDRVKAGALAVGEVAINFIPIGKIGGIGAKVLRISGGARALQRVRNALMLGAEVAPGTVIKHFTTEAGAKAIAESGTLKGSERGFLSMAGKGEHLAVTRRGLARRLSNNGQVYALAADGATTHAGSVVDAIVGVPSETNRVGQVLGKISKPKTSYGAYVEHALTPEEAANSRRWGRTIVTNVPPERTGLAVRAQEVRVTGSGTGTVAAAQGRSRLERIADKSIGRAVGATMRHGDLAAFGFGKVMIQQYDHRDP